MRISHTQCPGCGKAIDLDWDWTYLLCQYCRAKCVIISHNHPETPQETLERLHGEAWQSMEEQKYALAYGQYREILQHRIDDGEAWHNRALAIGLRALDKENLRANEVFASFDEGLRRDPTPRGQLIYAMKATFLAETLHQFHYLHFRREPLHALRWLYYRNASTFALRLLRQSQAALQELLTQPSRPVPLLLQAANGYEGKDLHAQASETLQKNARITAAIDHALLLGSLRLATTSVLPANHLSLNLPHWFDGPRDETLTLRKEYAQATKLSTGAEAIPPKRESHRYFRPYVIFLICNLFLAGLTLVFLPWAKVILAILSLIAFFGFVRPIRHRNWDKYCYASDVRAGVFDYH